MPRLKIESLKKYLLEVFGILGTPKENAIITADVLLSADRRNIASHGVARLDYYVEGIEQKSINPRANPTVIKQSPATLLVDGNGGLGHVISVKTMRRVIRKAQKTGMASAVIRNSNHYGIAGYTAMMALEYNLIGFSATNTPPFTVPTFGKNAALGTNPLAIAVPAGNEYPFVLDMATSTVALGKLEICQRLGKRMPSGWAQDKNGELTDDAQNALEEMWARKGGGLLPLGGAGEENAGYKGYDLCALVDIITGGLAISLMGVEIQGKHGEQADISHFLMALDPSAYAEISDFKSRMDSFIRMLKNQPCLEGEDRIWIAGEKEWEAQERNKEAVDIDGPTFDKLKRIGKKFGVNTDNLLA